MEHDKYIKAIMNPTRMRIMQYLILHKQGTTAQIKEVLCDIPSASLYRHVKILEENSLICVRKERRIRGTIEKTYELNQKTQSADELGNKHLEQLINSSMFNIMGQFHQYLNNENNNPMDDMLCLSTTTLLLSDMEFNEFMNRLGELIKDVAGNLPEPDRKIRRFTIISSPVENNT